MVVGREGCGVSSQCPPPQYERRSFARAVIAVYTVTPPPPPPTLACQPQPQPARATRRERCSCRSCSSGGVTNRS